MNLQCVSPPKGLQELVAKAITRLDQRRFAGKSYVKSAIPVAPQKIFTIQRDDLKQNRGLVGVNESGWIVFLLNGDKAAAALTFFENGTDLQFKGLHYGPFVASAQKGIEIAEAGKTGNSANYELRMLDMPSVHLMSLWLHGNDDDFFIPLDPAPLPLHKQEIYSSHDFLGAASEIALSRPDAIYNKSGAPTN